MEVPRGGAVHSVRGPAWHMMDTVHENASLVQQHLPGRYRMHDLIRLSATDRQHQYREAALRRMVDFYAHTANTAARLLHPHRDPVRLAPPVPGCVPQPLADDSAALAWFVAEFPCPLAAQHTAATHAWHPAAWNLAWALIPFRYRRRHRPEWLGVWLGRCGRGRAPARPHCPPPHPPVPRQRLRRRGPARRGDRAAGPSLALAEQHHAPTRQAHIHRTLAYVWGRRGDDRRALAHATDALDLFRGLDQPVWEVNALNDVGGRWAGTTKPVRCGRKRWSCTNNRAAPTTRLASNGSSRPRHRLRSAAWRLRNRRPRRPGCSSSSASSAEAMRCCSCESASAPAVKCSGPCPGVASRTAS